MSQKVLAQAGLARLKIPCPTIKLRVAHSAAEAIGQAQTKDATITALIEMISGMKLESEILEALSIFFLTGSLGPQHDLALRSAIRWPSILSDLMIREALQSPLKIHTWTKSHSGAVSPLHNVQSFVKDLERGDIAPRILRNGMSELEDALDAPMMRQWAYEMECLTARAGECPNGHWTYFRGSHEQDETGQIISPKCHLARSAYLRTLAYAFDVLEAPYEMVRHYALYASAIDFFLCRMGAGLPRSWSFQDATLLRSKPEFQSLVEQACKEVLQDRGQHLWHLSSILPSTKTYNGEIEIATVVYEDAVPVPDDAFAYQNYLVGRMILPRTADHRIVVPPQDAFPAIPSNGGHFTAGLVPTIGSYAGYFHTELIGRPAFLPINLASETPVIVSACAGGADLVVGEQAVGRLDIALRRWHPVHSQDFHGNSMVLLSMEPGAENLLLGKWASNCTRVWRAKVRTREKDYGDWTTITFSGEVPFTGGKS